MPQLIMKLEKYKITFWNKNHKAVEDKYFYGASAFSDAVEWGRKNLTNFNTDLIQKVD